MPDFHTLLQHPLILETGAWLLHFSWQAVVLAGFLWIALRLLKNARPEVRYLACWLSLGLMVLLPTLTVLAPAYLDVHQYITWTATGTASTVATTVTQSAGATTPPASAPSFNAQFSRLLSFRGYLVILWVLGVAGYGFRLQTGIRRMRQLKSSGDLAGGTLTDQLLSLAHKMNIRFKVRLLISSHIDQPLLTGWLKPVILLPAGLLTGLPPVQLQAILAHELAHVRRHDYFFSILQAILETLFFFHPAIWCISSQIRNEREYCCDALAVATLRDRKLYLSTLSSMERYRTARQQVQPALSMQDGALLDRAKRIAIHSPHTPSSITMKTKSILLGTALLAGMLLLTAASMYKPLNAQVQPEPSIAKSLEVKSGVRLQKNVGPNTVKNDVAVHVGPVIHLNVEVSVNPSVAVSVVDKPSLHPLQVKTKVSSGYGMRMHPVLKLKRMHRGIDFPVKEGMAVYATADGTVKTVLEDEAYGKHIVITHSDGYETWYSSLSAFDVGAGDVVKAGEKIGATGNTGMSTAPHLHYEVRLNGEAVDPADYLPAE